jgi:hypothetical protein
MAEKKIFSKKLIEILRPKNLWFQAFTNIRINKNEIHDIPVGGFIEKQHKKSQHKITAEIFFITHFVFYPLQYFVPYIDAV